MSKYTFTYHTIFKNQSDGIADLISAQKNLKYLKLKQYSHIKGLMYKELPNAYTVTKLVYYVLGKYDTSLSFISKFTNLQQLILTFIFSEDFALLQYVNFPQLQFLKIRYMDLTPSYEPLVNFLEINGSHLREFH
ncbi:hypothetical protein GLOIN_2v1573959 [Rhizophagus clarus]|uniref:Uncharacterized protein n=1 Tax=Rhizophagus clarus TaxID=94130 RepID=A0A8H3M9X4_9GLOM|nr:hypothetical protein GLOIN_2v1573959 [Rhizophagus clarus]